MCNVPPHDIESVLDKYPANVEDDAKKEGNKSLLVLSGEEKEAANVGAEYSNDIDHQPWYEVVRLLIVCAINAKDVTEEEQGETEEFTTIRKYVGVDRN